MLSADDAPPVDRPNLSKDYLAGTAPEDWVPLRATDFYAEHGIELRAEGDASPASTRRARDVALADGSKLAYDALLLATGAEPVRLRLPGSDLPHVHTLRTLGRQPRHHCAAAKARSAPW